MSLRTHSDLPAGPWRKRPGRLLRAFNRTPLVPYRLGLGGLFGKRMLVITHRGRKSGRLRRTLVEVVRHDPATDEFVVVSGRGDRADWYRNIVAAPAVEVQAGRQRFLPASASWRPRRRRRSSGITCAGGRSCVAGSSAKVQRRSSGRWPRRCGWSVSARRDGVAVLSSRCRVQRRQHGPRAPAQPRP